MPTTLGDLTKALAALNAVAEAINLGRKFDLTRGSQTNGNPYLLHETPARSDHSDHDHPKTFAARSACRATTSSRGVDTRIGSTRTEAYHYLKAVTYGFEAVARNAATQQSQLTESRANLELQGSWWIELNRWTDDELENTLKALRDLASHGGSPDRVQRNIAEIKAEIDRRTK